MVKTEFKACVELFDMERGHRYNGEDTHYYKKVFENSTDQNGKT